SAPARLRGDEAVEGADRRALGFQTGADVPGVRGVDGVEGRDFRYGGEKIVDAREVPYRKLAFRRAVAQLEQDDRGNQQPGLQPDFRPEALGQARLAL